MWIGTEQGVVRWTGTEIAPAGIPAGLANLQALSMIRDRAGSVWITAGSGGLVRVDHRGRVSRSMSSSSPAPNVSSVFEDREGNIWVGTDRGIERWRDPPFTSYSTPEGLPPSAVGPVYVDARGRAWFAPTSGGLFWIDDGVVGRVTEAGLDRDIVYSIAGSGSDVWVGTQRGVACVCVSRSGVVGPALHLQRRVCPADSFYAVTVARDGAVLGRT